MLWEGGRGGGDLHLASFLFHGLICTEHEGIPGDLSGHGGEQPLVEATQPPLCGPHPAGHVHGALVVHLAMLGCPTPLQHTSRQLDMLLLLGMALTSWLID
jgi:hypothetical protein